MMKKKIKKTYRYILFDLDGTLTDPAEGIIKGIQYALRSFGIEEKKQQKLESCIGPSLHDSFLHLFGFEEENVAEAIAKYREYYSETGLYENEIYPGIKELLIKLKKNHCKLAVASSKPKKFVDQVLQHFEIDSYFDVVVGSELNGFRGSKKEVMQEALRQLFAKDSIEGDASFLEDLKREQIIMVGDRDLDMEGAKSFGIDCVGVLYGYAKTRELSKAKATYLAESVSELEQYISGSVESKNQDYAKSSFQKTMHILWPLLFYFLMTEVISYFLLQWLGKTEVYIVTYLILIPILFIWFWKEREDTLHIIKRRQKRKLLKGIPFLILCAASFSLVGNLVLSQSFFAFFSKGFQEMKSSQYDISLLGGILLYGMITPIAEEVVFRGLLYQRMKRYFSIPIAILVSSFIFGAYHRNVMQMIYATVLGVAMAMIYETYRRIEAPVLFHSVANIVIFTVTKQALLQDKAVMLVVFCASVLLSAFCTMYFVRLPKDT